MDGLIQTSLAEPSKESYGSKKGCFTAAADNDGSSDDISY